jgi:hypothetical protein
VDKGEAVEEEIEPSFTEVERVLDYREEEVMEIVEDTIVMVLKPPVLVVEEDYAGAGAGAGGVDLPASAKYEYEEREQEKRYVNYVLCAIYYILGTLHYVLLYTHSHPTGTTPRATLS